MEVLDCRSRGCWGVEMVGKRRRCGDYVAKHQHNKQNRVEREWLETD